jgi:endonuclease/exonuclease/phosphatase (EEP) superfamily protein YafD
MRLIAWNANGVRFKKRTFEESAKHLLSDQQADVVVISETVGPVDPGKPGVSWTPCGGLGLGVAVRDGLTLRAEKKLDSPVLSSAYTVTAGPVHFRLVAAWPVKAKAGPSYGEQLWAALADEVHGEFLRQENAILAGDFNSTAKIPAQAKRHLKFVERPAALGLKSVYHEKRGVAHGKENEGDHTYRHGGRGKGHFHIDYCFLSPALLRSAKVTILNGPEWEELSDHFPLQVDFSLPGLPTRR